MACREQFTSKYTDRPSPAFPANKCCDQVRQGNDGRLWQSVPDKRGICRWQKLTKATKKKVTAKKTSAKKPSKKKTTAKKTTKKKIVKSIDVIEPQDYSRVTKLTSNSDEIKERLFYDDVSSTGNHYPVTGSGADIWFVPVDVIRSRSTGTINPRLSKKLMEYDFRPGINQQPGSKVRMLTWKDIMHLDPTYKEE